MPTGTVKWFNKQKGFGFILPDEGGPDVFVHITALENANPRIDVLNDGQKVSFVLEPDRKGKMAAQQLKCI